MVLTRGLRRQGESKLLVPLIEKLNNVSTANIIKCLCLLNLFYLENMGGGESYSQSRPKYK